MQREERPAQVYLRASETRVVESGKRLAIGTLNPTEAWLNEPVPDGKNWQVSVSVNIQELDA